MAASKADRRSAGRVLRRIPAPLAPLALLSGLAALGSCAGPGHEATASNTHMFSSGDGVHASLVDPASVPPAPPQPPTRQQRLENDVEQILKLLLPQVKAMLKGLESAVAAVKVPEVLATNQPGLKAWRQDRRETYGETIESVYSEATHRLEDMRTSAVATAEARARELAPPPSPMDDGPTGDWILDQTLAAFDEVLVGALGFKELQVRSSQDAVRVVELFEVFSTFASRSGPDEGPVEEAMQGRIMLFVGGDETASAPRAVLVFRDDSAPTPRPLVLAQVTRHRIMRGRTLVADYGWRPAANTPAPGMPRTETMDQFLIAPHVEPTMDTSSPYYQQLRDMRIVVDTQSGFFDEAGALLGGVDWRIEFSVSARGDLTWQLAGGKPVFDPYCAEIRRTLGR